MIAPYGSWKSPISAELVGGAEVGLEQIHINGDAVYWIERRPQEGGRKVIVRRAPDGSVSDVTPPGFNARTASMVFRKCSAPPSFVSGTQSPSLNNGIGLGYVPPEFAKPGTAIEIEIRGNRSAAVVVQKPIYRKA